MISKAFDKLRLLRRLGSVPWRVFIPRALRLYPDYVSRKGVSHSLMNITLEVTYRCNGRCPFCFVPERGNAATELTLAEIEALVQSVAPHKVSFFLTGGEPFVRTDCVDIIRTIKRHGLRAGVVSNLTLLDEAKIDALNDAGLDFLMASIHGPRDVHNAILGAPVYDRCLELLTYWRSLPRRKTGIIINNVITPDTMPYMPKMVETAARIPADAITFQHETFLTPGDTTRHTCAWRRQYGENAPVFCGSYQVEPGPGLLDPEQLTVKIAEARRRGQDLGFPVFVKPDLDDAGIRAWYTDNWHTNKRCSYLYTDARITPSGDLVACQFIPMPLGNIRETGFFEMYNGAAFREFRQKIQQAGGVYPGCARCCKLYRTF